MPISTQCPKCLKVYKLKDELLGKRATCANAECRTMFEVKPYVAPPKPAPKPMDAEAIAAAALNDDPDPIEAIPEDLRKIAMTCATCEHKYEVPWAMQGKNALCPECKHRQRVPEQIAAGKVDWRSSNARRPTLAKQEEVPDDIWGAKQGQVSIGALKDAGAIKGIEYEPIATSFKVKVGSIIAAVLVLIVAGSYFLYKSKKHDSQIKKIDDAEVDFAKFKDVGIPPAYAPQFVALSKIAVAEFNQRLNTPEGMKLALQSVSAARQALQDPTARGMDRDMLAVELIPIAISFGGDNEQLKTGSRIPWEPGGADRKAPPLMIKDRSVIGELQSIFQTLLGNNAEFELRLMALRRTCRELDAKGHINLAVSLVGSGFRQEEQNEASAVILLEKARLGSSVEHLADEVKNLVGQITNTANVPAAIHAIALVAKVKGPTDPPAMPGSSGAVTAVSRMTYTLVNLAQNQPNEALAIAKLPGSGEDQLTALALVADQSPSPAEAVAAAMQIVAPVGPKPVVPQSVYERLARAAGAAGNDAAVDAFVAAIGDEGLKAWARTDALRARIQANPTMKAEDTIAAPEDIKKLRAGAAWAKMLTFRQNVRVANSGLEAAANALPSGTLKAFALYGLALGAQDETIR